MIMPFFILSQDRFDLSDLDFKDQGVFYQGKLVNCSNCEIIDDGKIIELCSFVKGKRHGESTSFRSSGYKIGNYVDGELEGVFKWYNKDRVLTMERKYNEGYELYEKGYHSNGQVAYYVLFNQSDGSVVDLKCWDEKGSKIDCKEIGVF